MDAILEDKAGVKSVNRLKKGYTTILATKKCAKELGKEITIVKPGIELDMGDIKIRTIEAYNEKREEKGKLMHKKGDGVGYIVTINGKRIYHAGDTDLIPEMECLKNIDVALLPIGGKNVTMDLADAVKAAKKSIQRLLFPCIVSSRVQKNTGK